MPLYLRQLPLGPMKNFVYLLGPQEGEEALVVDPAWDVPALEAAAAADGRRLVAAFVTHHHGDHINGLEELLGRHDVPVYAQREEAQLSERLQRLSGALVPLGPGESVQVGSVAFQALHTPGHTAGSQCLFAGGTLVSGDTLFVNGCGRCDLPGGDPEAMYRTLTQVLGRLPAGTRLLPGHDYGDVRASSLERERTLNPYLQFHDLDAFVKYRMRPRT